VKARASLFTVSRSEPSTTINEQYNGTVKIPVVIAVLLLLVSIASAEPVKIDAFVYLVDLREIEGAKGMFSADVFLRLKWHDPELAGEKNRVIPVNSVWNPNVQVLNRISVQTTLPEVLDVDASGNVTYRQRFIGQFSANLNLRQFPFDTQRLLVNFVALGQTLDKVKFVQDPQIGGIAKSLAITDWEIGQFIAKSTAYEAVPGAPSLAGFTFEIIAKRRFFYFMVQIILPMTLILGMSWIVFWIDANQMGPRISTSITSMLTLVAYRFLTGSFLPRLPYLTRLDIFIFGCTFLVFCSLLVVIWISRLLLAKQNARALSINDRCRWFFPVTFLLMVTGSFLF
jgi:hypothetical protein